MFDMFAQLFPASWQHSVLAILAPLRLLAHWQSTITPACTIVRVLVWVALLGPALLLAAGMWCTALSFYTLPFRSGRGAYITSMLMAWWDACRCILLYWTGMVRVVVAFVGWIIGSVRFSLLMIKNVLLSVFRSPLTLIGSRSCS